MGDPRTDSPDETMDPSVHSDQEDPPSPSATEAAPAKGRKSIDLYDVATLAKINYEEEKISPLRQLRQMNDTFRAKERKTGTLPSSHAAKGVEILNNNSRKRSPYNSSRTIELSENVRNIMARRNTDNYTGSLRVNQERPALQLESCMNKRHSLDTNSPTSSDPSVRQTVSDEHLSVSDEPFSVSDEQTTVSDECFTKRSSSPEDVTVVSPEQDPNQDYYYTKPPSISNEYFRDTDEGDIFDRQGSYINGSTSDQEEWPPCPEHLIDQSHTDFDYMEPKRDRKLPGVLQIPNQDGRLPSQGEDYSRKDDQVIYDFTCPKPVIEVKLAKTPTRPGPKYAAPTKRGTVRMSKSSEDILNDNRPADQSTELVDNPEIRFEPPSQMDYHYSAQKSPIPQSPAGDDKTKTDFFQSTLLAMGDVMHKYDSGEVRQLQARSFHEDERVQEEPDPLAELETADCYDDYDDGIVSESYSESHSSRLSPEPLPSPVSDMDMPSPALSVFSSPDNSKAHSDTHVTLSDVARVEIFYQGQGSQVTVCNCTAQLYEQNEEGEWRYVNQGIPLFILTSGQKKGQKRELRIILAEKGTGFRLWEDTINYLSNYRDDSPKVHTLQKSYNHMCRASFHMHSVSASTEFLGKFKEITSDPNDELWKVGKSKKSKKSKSIFSSKKSKKKLAKKDISQPCNFMHVTKVEPVDHMVLKTDQSGEQEEYRQRCNTSDW